MTGSGLFLVRDRGLSPGSAGQVMALMLSPLLAGATLERFGAPALWAGCLAVGAAVAVGHLFAAGPRRRRLAAMALEAKCARESAAAPA